MPENEVWLVWIDMALVENIEYSLFSLPRRVYDTLLLCELWALQRFDGIARCVLY